MKKPINIVVTLLVGGLLLWLVISFIPWTFIAEDNSKVSNARILLRNQAAAISQVYRTDKRLASSPEYLLDYMDPWNHAPKINFTQDNVQIVSAGPDGIFETRDDITVEERILP
ncbi:MAG TPA: hypothetical protein VE954_24255 [Oligoflexus sp.]|uniref:hypothetical protein n=1 Tax=Oligoflexus sp. TaxID=1971216 RepID=UPI002D7519BD|nr:hypothetical protein [Oligoflexus sp.]HYX36228.1 hypothetical protein [Oligoflexus sp.]